MSDSTASAPFIPVAPEGAIPEGTCQDFKVEGGSVLVCNAGGSLYAIADVCTHDGGPLGEADLFDCEVECPRHGARFDVRTGKATALPAVRPVATYAVRVADGQIEVQYTPPPPRTRPSSSRGYPFGGAKR